MDKYTTHNKHIIITIPKSRSKYVQIQEIFIATDANVTGAPFKIYILKIDSTMSFGFCRRLQREERGLVARDAGFED